jgi:hypothetical protein
VGRTPNEGQPFALHNSQYLAAHFLFARTNTTLDLGWVGSLMNPSLTVIIEHPFLEYLSWVAAAVIAVTAVVAAFAAHSQLGEMSSFREQRLKILNATLLMELDKRWDSQEMAEARVLWMRTRDDIDKIVSTQYPLANDGEKLRRVSDEWTKMLAQAREKDHPTYVKLVSI